MPERQVRRTDRQMSKDEALALLARGEFGVLSTADAEGRPYGVPLSYVWLDYNLYFHCAASGRKLDNLHSCSYAAFTVVGAVKPVYANNFTACYESVMVCGRVSLLEQINFEMSAKLTSQSLRSFGKKCHFCLDNAA